MNERIQHIVSHLLGDGITLTEYEVETCLIGFLFNFPDSYKEVIRFINGAEGEIGPDSWICLFTVEELGEVNRNHSFLMNQIPEYFLIGKDAADTGYAFHKVYGTFHSFGLMSDFATDSIDFMGNDFYQFLELLFLYRFKE